MALMARDNVQHYPTSWRLFNVLIKRYTVEQIGFSRPIADINRFGARFRVAKAFNGILLDSFQRDTVEGYNGLIKIFLMWSAFENFLKIFDYKLDHMKILFFPYQVGRHRKAIQQLDPDRTFFNFICEKLDNPNHRKEIIRNFEDEDANLAYLAIGIRHIFSHGILSPNAKGALSNNVGKICSLLFSLHMRVMDQTFTKTLQEFEEIN